MKTFLRAGAVVLGLSLGLGLVDGCSSSSSNGFGGTASDAGKDGSSTGAGGANGSGGSVGTGGGLVLGTGSGGGIGAAGDSGMVACAADGGCGAGTQCNPTTKNCVECLFDNECADGQRCISGACTAPVACATSRDCRGNDGGRTICDTTTKVCVQCAADADCGPHQVCAVDTCVASDTCTPSDGGVDAGSQCAAGQVCGASGKCVECVHDTDCSGGKQCFTGTCRTPCASDNACVAGNQLCNRTEGACVDCMTDTDCAALQYCSAGSCTPDVCAQGVKSCVGNAIVVCTANGDGILAPVACADGQQCVKSGTNATCETPHLADGGLPPPATCTDKQKNGDETDVDCGGSCKKCSDGSTCSVATDCVNSVCEASCSGLLCFPGTRDKTCRPAQCSDNKKNGNETDVDCGGDTCPRCPVPDACTQASDCESNICTSGKCVAAPCSADQCFCLLPTDQPCCKPSGDCGCATVFPFQGSCQ